MCAGIVGAKHYKGMSRDRVAPMGMTGSKNDMFGEVTKIMEELEGKGMDERETYWAVRMKTAIIV